MRAWRDLHTIIKTTVVYESTINSKVEHLDRIFKDMLQTQLISPDHDDKLWCFWYQ